MRNNFGFTLIELLVVMGIMSVLATITFGQYGSAQKKARDVQRKNDASAVVKALSFFNNDYKILYSSYVATPTLYPVNTLLSAGNLPLTGPAPDYYVYMSKVPKENKATVPVSDDTHTIKNYCYVTDNRGFGIFTNLENRNDGDCRDYRLDGAYACTPGEYFNYAITSPNVTAETFLDPLSLSGGVAPTCTP